MVVFIFHVVVLFQSSCNSCYTWWTTMKTAPLTLTLRRRWWRSCPLMMEIMSVLWRWRSKAQRQKGHIISHYELHVMLILLCILYCLDRDGSIIRWSLSLNIKIIKCSSLVAPLLRLVVSKHHVMIGCDRFYMCIQRVQASFAHADTKVALTSLACTDMVSEHGIPKGRAWVIWMIWWTLWVFAFEATSFLVKIGLGVVDLVRVITKTMRGMLFWVGVHLVNLRINSELNLSWT